jgi:PAS domain S-box-containing protein
MVMMRMTDITRRKRAEEALQEIETLQHNLLTQLPVGVILVDALTRTIEVVNSRAAAMFGGGAQQMIGRRCHGLLCPTEETSCPVLDLGQEVDKSERVMLCADGSQLPILKSVTRVQVEGREKLLECFEDITERKRTEEALSANSKYLRASQQIAHLGHWHLNVATNQVFWSEELYKMYDFDPSLPPPPCTEHMKLFTPESWERLSTAWANTRETGIAYELELETLRRDGINGWMWVRGEAEFDPEGEIVGLWGAAQDITSRKCAERRDLLVKEVLTVLNRPNNIKFILRDIMLLIKEHTGIEAVGIRLKEDEDFPYIQTNGFPGHFVELESQLCARDEAGRILRNAQGQPLLECMCGNVICGRTNPSLPFFTAAGSFWSNCTSDLLASTTETERQARTRSRCNAEGYESVALIPLRAGDETIGLLQLNDHRRNQLTLDEITFLEGMVATIGIALSRVRDDERQNRLQAQMAQSQRLESIGTLASGVAHEINNPLNVVMNCAQLILDEPAISADSREYAAMILGEGERMAGIVRSLLAFSRNHKESHSPADVATLIESTLVLVRALYRKEHIELVSQLSEGLPKVRCRSQQIQQVLMNLLSNARDALNDRFPEASPEKWIRLTAAPFVRDQVNWVRLTVEDRGGGIPTEIADRVFDPFLTTKPTDKGTGLGLSISHGIVKEHGGELWFESEAGIGTRFHVELKVDNGWSVPQPLDGEIGEV